MTVVASAQAWIVRFALTEPIHLGRWTIRHREYAVLELTTDAGAVAASYVLTRDMPVAGPLDALAAAAVGSPVGALQALAATPSAQATDVPRLRAGALLDACAWDLEAQAAGVPLWRLLAADDDAERADADAPPAAHGVAVCGYPQGLEGIVDAVGEAAAALERGYRYVKVPGLGTTAEVDARLEAIRALDDDLGILVDLEGSFTALDPVLERARRWAPHRPHWIEDPFMPAGTPHLDALVAGSPSPIAIGDEWLPEEAAALLDVPHAPIVRLDHATLGGLTPARELAVRAGGRTGLHIYPELQRHLVHAGLAEPCLDIYMERPEIDFADRLLGDTAVRAPRSTAPREPGPCMALDHEAVRRQATWLKLHMLPN